MPITNQEKWNEYVRVNTDPYSKACVDVAREAMRLLDEANEFDPHRIIGDADKNIDAGGITGFMAGCVAQMIKECHSRGADFNDKWNELFGVSKEKAEGGTVNPAILTFNGPEKK